VTISRHDHHRRADREGRAQAERLGDAARDECADDAGEVGQDAVRGMHPPHEA
jgi:hypothetical protein